MKRFNHILITGASSGIGEALALHYAAPGVTLTLSGRDRQRLMAVDHACVAKGAAVHISVIDVTDAQAMREWIVGADERQPLDLVIANAGISGGVGGGQGSWVFESRQIFDVNVTGVINTVEPALPRMMKRKSGQIAIMASLASFSPLPQAPAYSASKAAVRFYGEGLRGALAKNGVGINIICPGFIESRMTAVNPYPMPFLMPADKAAAIMAKGIARNRGRIAFPWLMYVLTGFLGVLPHCLSQAFLSSFPAKPSRGL